MRERLTALALSGTKAATAGLLQQDYLDESEPVDEVGEHQVLLGNADDTVATVEVTRVEIHGFLEVPWEFARDEGEGFTSIQHWRDGHRAYYERRGIDVDDDTKFVCTWFRVVD